MTQAIATGAGRSHDPADGAALLIADAGGHDAGVGGQMPAVVAEQVQHPFAAIQPVQILERAGLLHHEHLGAQGKQLIQFVRGEVTPGLETPVHGSLLMSCRPASIGTQAPSGINLG
ncbi:hypothetical protein D3C80_1884060 [compost metagenome]